MWKACPHCREYSFAEHELLDLSYFTLSSCKSCGKLVRNDGFRQLLLAPAIITGVIIGALILFVMPEWLTPLGWVLVVVLGVAPLIALPKPVKADTPELNLTPYAPDLNNDKLIAVCGWNEEELFTILKGFAAEGFPGAQQVRIVVHAWQDSCYRLTFPEDMHPSNFTALVNYLLHPIELDGGNRSLIVAGQATLDTAFEGIPESSCGTKALLYVPDDDQDHDVVFLQTEPGAVFANCFQQETGWHPVRHSRLPLAVKRLAESL